MRPIKPFLSKQNTFAKKNTNDLNSRYKKALDDRKKLIKNQYTSDTSLSNMYKAKGLMMDRKISNLQSKIKDSK